MNASLKVLSYKWHKFSNSSPS